MSSARISLSEVLGALSYALDLTEGQPPGHVLRTCLLGMRLAGDLRLDSDAGSDLYYALLLKDAGCSSNSARTAELFGSDEHLVKRNLKTVDWQQTLYCTGFAARSSGIGRPPPGRLSSFIRVALAGPESSRRMFEVRCERGADIARRLGFSDATARAIRNLDEHWNGRGKPDGRAGEEIPLAARIAGLAQTIDVFLTSGGPEAVFPMLLRRRGRWFDPRLVDLVLKWRSDEAWWEHLLSGELWKAVAEAEPADRVSTVDEDGLERIAQAFADIIDAKSPYTYRHSSGVAEYARGIATQMGLGVDEERHLYHAGLLHDIGKLGVSSRILDKESGLTEEERREIERHPEYSWEILRRVSAFRDVAWTAARHHERLDGQGYPWGLAAEWLDLPARILAAADVFEALTANRPYRGGLTHAEAIAVMRVEQGAHLDPDVITALEETLAGRPARPASPPLAAAAS